MDTGRFGVQEAFCSRYALLVSWKPASKNSPDRLELPAMPNSIFQTLLGACRAPVDANGLFL